MTICGYLLIKGRDGRSENVMMQTMLSQRQGFENLCKNASSLLLRSASSKRGRFSSSSSKKKKKKSQII